MGLRCHESACKLFRSVLPSKYDKCTKNTLSHSAIFVKIQLNEKKIQCFVKRNSDFSYENLIPIKN